MHKRFIIKIHKNILILLISNEKYTITRTKENLEKLDKIVREYIS